METNSSLANDEYPGRCPICRSDIVAPYHGKLTELPCPACKASIWCVCVGAAPRDLSSESTLFVFNKNALSADDWRGIQNNIPSALDDSIAFIEMLMYLESMVEGRNGRA